MQDGAVASNREGEEDSLGAQPIICGTVDVDLGPCPIEPTWVRAGTPTARNAVLSVSRDRASCTVVWDCSPGAFEWRYDSDETIHILEGSVLLDDGFAPPRRLGPGAVVLFPAGAVVRWTVETHLRKLAFFHRPVPLPVSLASRALGRVRGALRRLRSSGAPGTSSAAPGMAMGADTAAG